MNKRRSDPDYRQNQALAQRAWGETHGDDWRHYRLTHPDYCEQNRVLQRERDLRRRGGDLSSEAPAQADLAKMDALTVKITVLSKGPNRLSGRRNLAKEDVIGAREPPC